MKIKQVTDPIKVAQPRTNESFKKPYVPAPHPQEGRLKAFRELPSQWTPGTIPTGKQ